MNLSETAKQNNAVEHTGHKRSIAVILKANHGCTGCNRHRLSGAIGRPKPVSVRNAAIDLSTWGEIQNYYF